MKKRIKVKLNQNNVEWLKRNNLLSSRGVRKIIEYNYYQINKETYKTLSHMSNNSFINVDSIYLNLENEKKLKNYFKE